MDEDCRLVFCDPAAGDDAGVPGRTGGLEDWEIYSSTEGEALSNSLLVIYGMIWIACVWLYWIFASGLASRRLLSVTAVCGLAVIIDFSLFYLLLGAPIEDYFDAANLGQRFLMAMIGLGLATMTSPVMSRRTATPPKDH